MFIITSNNRIPHLLRSHSCDRLDLRKGKLFDKKKKKHWVDISYYRVVVYRHCQHTFQFKLLVNLHVASDDPFKTHTKKKILIILNFEAYRLWLLVFVFFFILETFI